MIRFLLNNQLVTVKDTPADLTLLNYLREYKSMNGTKEGCGSGDCGACTVVLAELSNDSSNEQADSLHYRTINSCITFLSALHGKQLITVEHLASGAGEAGLHPVQQAMVNEHASQCGFCTPGFVMSTFALYHSAEQVSREDVVHALSGNLCRCTGYRPIIDAALDSCNQPINDKFHEQQQTTITSLKAILTQTDDEQWGTEGLLMPRNRAEMRKALSENPDARLVAGSTDLALEVTQQLKRIKTLVSVTNMASMKQVVKKDDAIEIGAACAINDVSAVLLRYFPQLSEIIERFAALPVRNQATLGGNIANASPIGDMPPVLLALGATIVVDDGNNQRTMALSDFFTGYKQTLLQDSEWIERIVIPLPKAKSHLRAYKISKRNEDDISAVCAVFSITVEEGKITSVRTGFGGVSATPITSDELNQQLIGKTWHEADTMHIGQAILLDQFTPIDDVRATAKYRKLMLANLWHRFWLETTTKDKQIAVRVTDHTSEVAHA